MKYTFLKLAEDTLKKAGIPLSSEEIWEKSSEFGIQQKINTSGKTPARTIGAQIYVDLKDNENSVFCKVMDHPVKFGLKSFGALNSTTDLEAENNKNSKTKIEFLEKDLHPLLTKFVYGDIHFKCYTKTIVHQTTKKTSQLRNEWLHPDIVGVYFPFDDYNKETINLIDTFRDSAIKLFSFEMKRKIDIGTLRESFFQAVSNSSWANEGYLVALDYSDSSELIDEMRRLNNAFGIGFIKLNAENIEQSEILIAAHTKTTIDWETVNRLVANKDFKSFIKSINEDFAITNVKSDYDEIYSDIKLEKHIKDRHIC